MSDWYSFSWRGGVYRTGRGNLHILKIGTTLPEQDTGTWASVGPSWAPLGAARAKLGPTRPKLRTQCDTLKTCVFTAIFQRFLALLRARARPCCPHWACLGPHFGPRCSYRTKLRMQRPTCFQTCPSCAMLAPSWAQAGSKLQATGQSSAQVKPKLGPRLGQGRPSLTPVGFGWARYVRSLLLYPILWVRAVLVAKRLGYFFPPRTSCSVYNSASGVRVFLVFLSMFQVCSNLAMS